MVSLAPGGPKTRGNAQNGGNSGDETGHTLRGIPGRGEGVARQPGYSCNSTCKAVLRGWDTTQLQRVRVNCAKRGGGAARLSGKRRWKRGQRAGRTGRKGWGGNGPAGLRK